MQLLPPTATHTVNLCDQAWPPWPTDDGISFQSPMRWRFATSFGLSTSSWVICIFALRSMRCFVCRRLPRCLSLLRTDCTIWSSLLWSVWLYIASRQERRKVLSVVFCNLLRWEVATTERKTIRAMKAWLSSRASVSASLTSSIGLSLSSRSPITKMRHSNDCPTVFNLPWNTWFVSRPELTGNLAYTFMIFPPDHNVRLQCWWL